MRTAFMIFSSCFNEKTFRASPRVEDRLMEEYPPSATYHSASVLSPVGRQPTLRYPVSKPCIVQMKNLAGDVRMTPEVKDASGREPAKASLVFLLHRERLGKRSGLYFSCAVVRGDDDAVRRRFRFAQGKCC